MIVRPGMGVLLLLLASGARAQDEIPATPVVPAVPISDYRKIAMMPLSSLGSTDEAVRAIERVLLGELEKLLGARLVKPSELLTQGREVKVGLKSCEGKVVCLIEVVGGMGWDAFIVGNVAGLGEGRVINLKLFDVRSAGEVRRSSESASGDETTLIANMRKAAVELLAPELFLGAIEVQALQPGVNIVVDGRLVGTTPLASNRVDVAVGRHALEATGDGLVPFSDFVEVRYGEVVPVAIQLPQNTVFVGGDTPFRNRWWTWTLAGTGLVATGLGAYFNYLQSDAVRQIEQRAKDGRLGADQQDLYDQEQAQWQRALVFYGIGGTLLGGVGVLWVVDFF